MWINLRAEADRHCRIYTSKTFGAEIFDTSLESKIIIISQSLLLNLLIRVAILFLFLRFVFTW